MTEDCPEGWDFVSLGQITRKVGSGSTPRGGSESYQQTGVPLIRSMNVRFEGFTKEGLAFLNQKQADDLKEATVCSDDVLLNITGASIGRVTQAPECMDGARVNQHVCIIRPLHEIDPAYLSRYLASPSVQQMIWGEQYGATRQALTKGQILDFQIPFAPLNEQQRIVKAIDVAFEHISSARSHLSLVPMILKRFRQAVLAAACSGRLTEDWRNGNAPESGESLLRVLLDEKKKVFEARQHGNKRYRSPEESATDDLPSLPESWTWASPDQLSSAEDQYSLAIGPFGSNLKVSDYRADGVPLIFVRNIRSGIFAGGRTRFISVSKAEELRPHWVQPGDILVTKMGDPPGDGCVYPEGHPLAVITADCIKIRISPRLPDPRFFVHAINSTLLRNQMFKITRGVAQTKVSLERFKTLALPLPPILEQIEIVKRVESLFRLVTNIEGRVELANKRVQYSTQSILAKAFRGELVPTEAELARREGRGYEPASALLERINKEREAQTSSNPERKQGRTKNKLAAAKG